MERIDTMNTIYVGSYPFSRNGRDCFRRNQARMGVLDKYKQLVREQYAFTALNHDKVPSYLLPSHVQNHDLAAQVINERERYLFFDESVEDDLYNTSSVCLDEHFSNRDEYVNDDDDDENGDTMGDDNSNEENNGNNDGSTDDTNISKPIVLPDVYCHNYDYYTRWEHELNIYM